MNEALIDLALLYNMEGNINISKISGPWIIFKLCSQKSRAVNYQMEHWSSKSKPYLGCISSKKLKAEGNKRFEVPKLSLIRKCLLSASLMKF